MEGSKREDSSPRTLLACSLQDGLLAGCSHPKRKTSGLQDPRGEHRLRSGKEFHWDEEALTKGRQDSEGLAQKRRGERNNKNKCTLPRSDPWGLKVVRLPAGKQQ